MSILDSNSNEENTKVEKIINDLVIELDVTEDENSKVKQTKIENK